MNAPQALPLASRTRAPSRDYVSNRYNFVPTAQLLEPLLDEGWEISRSNQARTIRPGKELYARHSVFLRHPDMKFPDTILDKIVPEVMLTNAHTGEYSAILHAGLFRLICANGLTVPFGGFTSLRIRHNAKDIVPRIREGLNAARDLLPTIFAQVEKMMRRTLDAKEQINLAHIGLTARYGAVDRSPVLPAQLLGSRRPEDDADDAWTVMNRIQENILRGGFQGRAASGRTITVRPLNHPLDAAQINLDLWTATVRYAS